jgi:CRISPR-associated endonuclease Cas1
MQAQAITTLDGEEAPPPTPITVPKDGTVVLSGYGIRVRVERGHLVVDDGIGRHRRLGRFARATSGIRRLVILGDHGFVTLEATRWLADVGASITHLDGTGRVLLASARSRLDDARLRRAQALAASLPVGLDIARDLITRKLEGQRRVLVHLGATEPAALVQGAIGAVPAVRDTRVLMAVEADAAGAYWSAWETVPVRFSARDAVRVPAHWLTFGKRESPLAGVGPRRAGNPANAILNYLYAVLEAETVTALRVMGLDPGLGVLHVDQAARDSLALDVMEAVRPDVDQYVLDLLDRQVFTAADFSDGRDGWCRLSIPLAQQLAATAAHWGRLVAPVVEAVVRQLADAGLDAGPLGKPRRSGRNGSVPQPPVVHVPTHLTGARRSAGQGTTPRGPKPAPASMAAPRACAGCGAKTESKRHRYCTQCRPALGHSGRRSTVQGHVPSAAEVERFLGSVARVKPAQWRDVATRWADVPHERVAVAARTRRKRVGVRAARSRELMDDAVARCPVALRDEARRYTATVVLALAVRDVLPERVFAAVYRPLDVALPAAVWVGDEVMSEQQRGDVLRLYKAGHSGSAIGRSLGLDAGAVLRRLRAAGIEPRPWVRIADSAEVVRRHGDGESISQIAAALGVTPSAVKYHLARSRSPVSD